MTSSRGYFPAGDKQLGRLPYHEDQFRNMVVRDLSPRGEIITEQNRTRYIGSCKRSQTLPDGRLWAVDAEMAGILFGLSHG